MFQKFRFLKAAAAAAMATVALSAGQVASAPGQWEYAVQRGSEGEMQSVYARLRGEGLSYLWLACSRTAFDDERPPAIRVSAAVAQQQFLGPSDEQGRATVYWVDDQPPETSSWVYKDKYGQLIGEKRVKDFVASLSSAQKLKIELSNYRYESIELDFQIDSAETKAIADRFAKDCEAIRRRPA